MAFQIIIDLSDANEMQVSGIPGNKVLALGMLEFAKKLITDVASKSTSSIEEVKKDN